MKKNFSFFKGPSEVAPMGIKINWKLIYFKKRTVSMDKFIKFYFDKWKQFVSFKKYDRWCNENIEWLVKEPPYRDPTNYLKFVGGIASSI